MYQTNFSVYLGREDEQSFIGFSAENGFFAVLKVDAGLAKEKGRELLKKMSVELEQASIKNLNDFETLLADKFKEEDIPSGFSISSGLLNDNILLLKTVGTGQVYLRRASEFAKLIEGTSSASGYVAAGDFIIFTAKEFVQVFGTEEELKNQLADKNPHDFLETITPQLKTQNDTGTIALFVNFQKEGSAEEILEEPKVRQVSLPDKLLTALSDAGKQLKAQDKKKVLTFIGVGLILIVFVWSVFLGVQRRVGAQSQKKISSAKEVITEDLKQAEDVAFLNLPRSIELINEAKKNLADLERQVSDKENKDIQALEKLISDKEDKILKKEKKEAVEYFDLSVENKNAQGQKMYLDGENLAVYDLKGAAYLLSLTKKSIDKRESSDIKGASIITLSQNKIYVFRKGVGIFELSAEGKSKKVIDNDPDWKDVVDLVSYNGNLYLLDRGANEIYKYLVAENGFSQKTSYFQSGKRANLQDASSLAIDSSVYIGLPDIILKYVSGVQDTFSTSFPEENSKLTKIFTSKDIEKVYGWDRNKGAIYVIGKSGTYERQINSSIFAKASDFVVFGNNAYVLSGSKIYKVSIE